MPTLTIEVSDELHNQLQKLATDMERTVEQCHVWALEDFVAEEHEKVAADQVATADLKGGRFVTQEQMEVWVESLDTDQPLPAPQSLPALVQRAS